VRLIKSAARFCPYCGAEGLVEYKSFMDGLNQVAANLEIDVLLVKLLWQDWIKDDHDCPTLLDYVAIRLENDDS
jgi:hypothetical protein